MAFLDIFRRNRAPKAAPAEERGLGLIFNSISGVGGESTAMKLSAVYCATNQISNSVALLNIDVLKSENGNKMRVYDQLGQILNLSPDGVHSHYVFMKQLIESVILNGNGYALIERDEQLNVKSLRYINPAFVTVMPQPDGSVKYIVAGLPQAVDAVNMIHLYMHCDEVGNGISVLRYAYNTIQGNTAAESQARNYFTNGGALNGILKATATLNKEQKAQIKEAWNEAFTGNQKSGVAVLPQGLDYQPISVDPADQQLLESRQFGILEIARFFCIPPAKLMLWDDVSYNALEYAQLIYLTDTIQPYTQMIEDEFNKKLFKPSQVGKRSIKFNFTKLLVADNASKVKYFTDLLKNGVLSLNEVRDELGYEKIDNTAGETHWIQLSYASAEQIAEGKYIKGQSQTQNQNTDNNTALNEDK